MLYDRISIFFFTTSEQNKMEKLLHSLFASIAKDRTWKTLEKSAMLIELKLLEVSSSVYSHINLKSDK